MILAIVFGVLLLVACIILGVLAWRRQQSSASASSKTSVQVLRNVHTVAVASPNSSPQRGFSASPRQSQQRGFAANRAPSQPQGRQHSRSQRQQQQHNVVVDAEQAASAAASASPRSAPLRRTPRSGRRGHTKHFEEEEEEEAAELGARQLHSLRGSRKFEFGDSPHSSSRRGFSHTSSKRSHR